MQELENIVSEKILKLLKIQVLQHNDEVIPRSKEKLVVFTYLNLQNNHKFLS